MYHIDDKGGLVVGDAFVAAFIHLGFYMNLSPRCIVGSKLVFVKNFCSQR